MSSTGQVLPESPAADPMGEETVNPGVVHRRVAWRILPLIFLLYIVAYLDRANAGFAKLAMADDLHFSDKVFGLGFGIFFLGYLFLEIPGAIAVERWSARKWFARILVSWGICSSLTGWVHTPMQFYVARFVLGVAEAGFFPGIIVYFTHWFAGAHRGRALSGLIMGVPFSLALGAPLSGWLTHIDWLGWPGWRWLFVLEGLPAVLLGIVTWFYLPDRPRDARWLKPAERRWLEATLEAEAQAKRARGEVSMSQALRLPQVWLLALGIFATNTGGYAFGFWLPSAIQGLSGASHRTVLAWSGLVYACGLVSVYWSGRSSDRTGDRKWHCVTGQVGTAVFLCLSAIPGQPFGWVMIWLCFTGLMAYFWPAPFWALPSLTLTSSAAAVSIGFINMWANLAGFLGNYQVRWLKSFHLEERGLLVVMAAWYLLGALLVACLRVPRRPR